MNDSFSDSLMQMNFENPKEIQKKEFGKKIITQIWARENANTSSLIAKMGKGLTRYERVFGFKRCKRW